MAYVMGETVVLGVGPETTRGTGVAPAIWLPARTPSGIAPVVDRYTVQEARGTGIASQGTEIVQTRSEGDVEFNVKSISIGYLLRSLLGSVSSVTALGATTHTFSLLLNNPQHPSLTLALSQPNAQDYEYPLAVVSSLEIRTPVDDLVNATASFIAKNEAEHADYTPAFVNTDIPFRPTDLTVKFADDVAGLAAADAVCLKEFSFSINNNARPNQCIGSTNPADVLSLLTEMSGSFTVDYEGTSYHDTFKNGAYKAMQIEMVRDDLDVLGTSALYSTLRITLPKITFDEYTVNRPIDDIVTEEIGFTAHYDIAEAKAIEAVLINDHASYA